MFLPLLDWGKVLIVFRIAIMEADFCGLVRPIFLLLFVINEPFNVIRVCLKSLTEACIVELFDVKSHLEAKVIQVDQLCELQTVDDIDG